MSGGRATWHAWCGAQGAASDGTSSIQEEQQEKAYDDLSEGLDVTELHGGVVIPDVVVEF